MLGQNWNMQGLAGLAQGQAMPNRREGFFNYLQGQGYEGQMGPDMRAYAQQLRGQGQHPWLDYWHSMNPQATQGNGAGGGINPGSYDGSGINPGRVFTGGNFGPPHTVAPPTMGGSYGPQGAAGGLELLARRQPFAR